MKYLLIFAVSFFVMSCETKCDPKPTFNGTKWESLQPNTEGIVKLLVFDETYVRIDYMDKNGKLVNPIGQFEYIDAFPKLALYNHNRTYNEGEIKIDKLVLDSGETFVKK